MAKIINEECKRRLIRLSTNDVINIVREYQVITYGMHSYDEIRDVLGAQDLYVPEDLF